MYFLCLNLRGCPVGCFCLAVMHTMMSNARATWSASVLLMKIWRGGGGLGAKGGRVAGGV